MKTAMQELIEAIELITKKFKRKLSTEEILDMCNNQLDKEKEQIIISFIYNRYVNAGGYPIKRDEAEEYYNQTYNQDRITINETRRSIEGIGLLKKQSEGVDLYWKNQNK